MKRHSSSQRPPISPTSKKSKKNQNVPIEDQFYSKTFVDLQVVRLYKALGEARTSDSKVFYLNSLHECDLKLTDSFNKFGIRRFCMVGDDFYPELVREFYGNARKQENRNADDALNFGNIRVSGRVGQEILVDESLLNDLFGLSNKVVQLRNRTG